MRYTTKNYNDILTLFDTTNLSFEVLSEMIVKFAERNRKQPLLIIETNREELKKNLKGFIESGCNGILLSNPLTDI